METKRLTTAKKAAHLTGKMLLDHFNNGDRTGALKDDQTLVTEADKAADSMIQDLIRKDFTDDRFLSEEGNTVYPDHEHVWIIDPLDGTVNFSRGLTHWGVAIAHLRNGFPETTALYFPVTDELFSAVKGGGAELNGKPLQVSEDFDENLFPIFLHCSRLGEKYHTNLPYKKRSLGSAAYQLCLVASNRAVLGFESTPRIWDFAGSWLVVKEAGGLIESLGDTQPFPFQTGKNYYKTYYPIVAAVSQTVLDEAKKHITRR
jgi:myo-inositol-1(or 4)-monophosphatase